MSLLFLTVLFLKQPLSGQNDLFPDLAAGYTEGFESSFEGSLESASSALAMNSLAVSQNPAGLAFQKGTSVSFGSQIDYGLKELAYPSVKLAFPISQNRSGLGVASSYSGDAGFNTLILEIGAAQRLAKNLAIGLGCRLLQNSYEGSAERFSTVKLALLLYDLPVVAGLTFSAPVTSSYENVEAFYTITPAIEYRLSHNLQGFLSCDFSIGYQVLLRLGLTYYIVNKVGFYLGSNVGGGLVDDADLSIIQIGFVKNSRLGGFPLDISMMAGMHPQLGMSTGVAFHLRFIKQKAASGKTVRAAGKSVGYTGSVYLNEKTEKC